jgi:uroporphyrinogen-III synthase
LRAQRFAVERRVLYEARAATALNPAAVDSLRAGEVALALFFSPRTAAIFARLADVAGVTECCAKVVALSISRAADAALAGLPWHDRRIAERPNQPALLDALDQVLGRPRGTDQE